MADNNDFSEWKRLILDGIEQSKKDRAFLICKYNQLRTDYEVLKTKIAFISGLTGFVMSVITTVIIKYIEGK